jgi:predicted pyridoxine 5'-phosphate oxidase superfamily flavin-nucleotide-binding protein
MPLNDFSKELIKRFPLGFVATVTQDGMPSLSPKGTFIVLDDATIAFAEIRSPNTMENLSHTPKMEVNFIDIWLRKGIRVFGSVEVAQRGSSDFETLFPIWDEAFSTLSHRINAIVKINAERVKLMTTPPYDDGVTEDEMLAIYKDKWGKVHE